DLLAQRFGGRLSSPAHGFLEKWQATVRQMKDAFSSEQAEVLLVTSPETFSLNEAVRSIHALKESAAEMRLGAIVLNRVVTSAENCSRCRARVLQGKKAVQFLKTKFRRVPRLLGPDPGNPLLGARQLQRFGDTIFGKSRILTAAPPKVSKRKLNFAKINWPVANITIS